MRVDIPANIIKQARERANFTHEDLLGRFKNIVEWEKGDIKPTLKQLEKFAKAVYLPFDYLFLPELPKESLPIPDFRTVENQTLTRPSPNLLDVVYACQERQSWYKQFSKINRLQANPLIGSATISEKPELVADRIRQEIGFTMSERAECKTWEEALRLFIRKSDEANILVMVSGVVFSNNTRKLDCNEFRGFALADTLAPLIFINGSDSKSAQMFTLAHELAHLFLNSSGVSNVGAVPLSNSNREEVWCNAVAAELLVPLRELKPLLKGEELHEKAIKRLTKFFKVSSLVIIRRLFDAGWLNQNEFNALWAFEKAKLKAIAEKTSGGGDFYRTTIARVSSRFTRVIVSSTLEGQTLYRDAFRMLGVSKTNTFAGL